MIRNAVVVTPLRADHQYFNTISEYKEKCTKSGEKILGLIDQLGKFITGNKSQNKRLHSYYDVSSRFSRVKDLSGNVQRGRW